MRALQRRGKSVIDVTATRAYVAVNQRESRGTQGERRLTESDLPLKDKAGVASKGCDFTDEAWSLQEESEAGPGNTAGPMKAMCAAVMPKERFGSSSRMTTGTASGLLRWKVGASGHEYWSKSALVVRSGRLRTRVVAGMWNTLGIWRGRGEQRVTQMRRPHFLVTNPESGFRP